MLIPQECIHEIEDGWKKHGKSGALRGVERALSANVTHEGPGGERCTIEELDRSQMRTIGLHVGVIVGEAKDSYELIEKLKNFDLYSIPGLPPRARKYLGDPEFKGVRLSYAY